MARQFTMVLVCALLNAIATAQMTCYDPTANNYLGPSPCTYGNAVNSQDGDCTCRGLTAVYEMDCSAHATDIDCAMEGSTPFTPGSCEWICPTTEAPTTEAPTTEAPTTEAPTTEAPTTEAPTTEAPTTEAPTTEAPTTEAPTTEAPTTEAPTTQEGDCTCRGVTAMYDTACNAHTVDIDCANEGVSLFTPGTCEWICVEAPTTEAPTTEAPTADPRADITFRIGGTCDDLSSMTVYSGMNGMGSCNDLPNAPGFAKSVQITMNAVTGQSQVQHWGTLSCADMDTVQNVACGVCQQEHNLGFSFQVDCPAGIAPPTAAPTTQAPTTEAPTTEAPTTEAPTTEAPTTEAPTTEAPTTEAPTTEAPTTEVPTTEAPTTEAPTTEAPTTEAPTTDAPTTEAPTTEAPTTQAPANICEDSTATNFMSQGDCIYADFINGQYCPPQDQVIVGETCEPGDFEGMVCDNDNSPEQAYCSFGVGSRSCAYCSSQLLENVVEYIFEGTCQSQGMLPLNESECSEWTSGLGEFQGTIVDEFGPPGCYMVSGKGRTEIYFNSAPTQTEADFMNPEVCKEDPNHVPSGCPSGFYDLDEDVLVPHDTLAHEQVVNVSACQAINDDEYMVGWIMAECIDGEMDYFDDECQPKEGGFPEDPVDCQAGVLEFGSIQLSHPLIPFNTYVNVTGGCRQFNDSLAGDLAFGCRESVYIAYQYCFEDPTTVEPTTMAPTTTSAPTTQPATTQQVTEQTTQQVTEQQTTQQVTEQQTTQQVTEQQTTQQVTQQTTSEPVSLAVDMSIALEVEFPSDTAAQQTMGEGVAAAVQKRLRAQYSDLTVSFIQWLDASSSRRLLAVESKLAELRFSGHGVDNMPAAQALSDDLSNANTASEIRQEIVNEWSSDSQLTPQSTSLVVSEQTPVPRTQEQTQTQDNESSNYKVTALLIGLVFSVIVVGALAGMHFRSKKKQAVSNVAAPVGLTTV